MPRILALAGVALLVAVSCNSDASPDGERTEPTRADSSHPAEPPEERLEVDRFKPLEDDVYLGLKKTAGRVVQEISSYLDDESWSDVVRRAVKRFGVTRAALSKAKGLHVESAASTAEIVYPQLGGLHLATTPGTASVMVVVEQTFVGAEPDTVVRTVDVRLTSDGDRWRVETVDSDGGESVNIPDDLSPEARAVLNNPRIDLADSARWDIYRGDIEERLLVLMTQLARDYTYAVTVLKSGHPPHVFATENVSNHTVGRAVDIWMVEDEAVVSQRGDTSSPAYKLTRGVFERGDVPEIGSPWDFDGGGGRSFTNDVHLDHIHLGYDSGS